MRPTPAHLQATPPLLTSEQLVVPGELGEIGRVRSFARCAAGGLSSELLTRFELAVVEAFTNIVRHGLIVPGTVHLRAEIYLDHVSLVLAHRGEVFVPPAVEAPIMDPDREGGMGLFLIAQGADGVFYGEQTEGLVGVRLVKYLHGEGRDGSAH